MGYLWIYSILYICLFFIFGILYAYSNQIKIDSRLTPPQKPYSKLKKINSGRQNGVTASWEFDVTNVWDCPKNYPKANDQYQNSFTLKSDIWSGLPGSGSFL